MRYINLIAVLVIVLFSYLIAERSGAKLDLTENKAYTLADITRNTLAELASPLEIKLVVSPEIPPQESISVRYFADLLEEYKQASNGRLNYEVISLTDPAQMDQAARLYGIPPRQINTLGGNNVQIMQVYTGAAVIYQDKREVFPTVSSGGNVEYELTTIIRQMISPEKKKLAILDAGGSFTQQKGFSITAQALAKLYDVQTVKLTEGAHIDRSFDVALLFGPKAALKDYQAYAVMEFLAAGRSVIMGLDRVQADIQMEQARAEETGLEDLLGANGITIRPELVYDPSATVINIPGADGRPLALRYPFFPEVVQFSHDEPIVKDLNSVTLIYASPIDVAETEGLTTEGILFSTPQVAVEGEPFNVSFRRQYTADEFHGPARALGVIARGRIVNPYQNPPKEYDPVTPVDGATLMLISDADFAEDDFITTADNARLLFGAIDVFAQDAGMLSLRGKAAGSHPVTVTSAAAKSLLNTVAVFFPPALAVIFGFGMLVYVRKRRASL